MEKKLNVNGKLVLDYVMAHDGDCTAADIVEATGLGARTVNGILTSTFCRNRFVVDEEKVIVPLMERVEAEVEVEVDGKVKHQTIKLIKMTDAGKEATYTVD